MKVVLGSDNYPPGIGGAEVVAANIVKGMVALGNQVAVIAPGNKIFGHYIESADNVKSLRVKSLPVPIDTRQRVSLHSYRVISRFLDEFKPDVIQANNVSSITRDLMRYGRSKGVPVVAGSHVMPSNYFSYVPWLTAVWGKQLEKWGWKFIVRAYSQATAVVGPTQTALNYLIQAGLRIPTKAISNGIDIVGNHEVKANKASLRKELGLQDLPTVIYIGRISPEKRLDVLLRAMAHLNQTLPAQLIVVGRQSTKQNLISLARDLGIGQRLVMTGFLKTDADKVNYLAASDVFAIASPAELQSIVTLEAMACAKPIVAVRAGALPELVHEGKNGQLFEDGDDKMMANGLQKILTRPNLMESYGQESRRIAETHDIRLMPKNYEEYYTELIGSGRSPGQACLAGRQAGG